MWKINKFLAVILSFAIVLSLIPAFNSQAGNLKLNRTKLTIEQGSTAQLTIVGKPNKAVKWTSSNKNVATVSKGLVKANKEGKTTIIAKIGKKKLTCKVVVKSKTSNNSIQDDDSEFKIEVREGINCYVVKVTNVTNTALDIKIIFTSYNDDGSIYQSNTKYCYGIAVDSYGVLSFDKPFKVPSGKKYDISYVTRNVEYKTYKNDLFDIELNVKDGVAVFFVTNKTGETISGINIAYTFYDEKDRLLYGDTITSEEVTKNGELLVHFCELWNISEVDKYGNLISYVPDIDTFAYCVSGYEL